MLQTHSPNSPRTRQATLAKAAAAKVRASKPTVATTTTTTTNDENATPAPRTGAKRSLVLDGTSKRTSTNSKKRRKRGSATKRGSPNPYAIMSIMADTGTTISTTNKTPSPVQPVVARRGTKEGGAAAVVAVAATTSVPVASSASRTMLAMETTTTVASNTASKKKKMRKSSSKKKRKKINLGMGLNFNNLMGAMKKDLTKQSKTPPGIPANPIPFEFTAPTTTTSTDVFDFSTSTTHDTAATTLPITAIEATPVKSTQPLQPTRPTRPTLNLSTTASFEHSPQVSSPLNHEQNITTEQTKGSIQRRNSRRLSGIKKNVDSPNTARAKYLAKKAQENKERLSRQMNTPDKKKLVREAQAKKELMKSSKKKKFEQQHGINHDIPSPPSVPTTQVSAVGSAKNRRDSFSARRLSSSSRTEAFNTPNSMASSPRLNMSMESDTSVHMSDFDDFDFNNASTSSLSPNNDDDDDENRYPDTPVSGVSSVCMDDLSLDVATLENNIEEDTCAVKIQQVWKGYRSRTITNPMMTAMRQHHQQQEQQKQLAMEEEERLQALAAHAVAEAKAVALNAKVLADAQAAAQAAAEQAAQEQAKAVAETQRLEVVKKKREQLEQSKRTVLRRQKAAQDALVQRKSQIKMAAATRGYFIRKKKLVTASIAAIVLVQNWQRARLAKRFVAQRQHQQRALLEQRASVLVQRIYRGWQATRQVRSMKAIFHYQTVVVQGCVEIWRKRTEQRVRLHRAAGTCPDKSARRLNTVQLGQLGAKTDDFLDIVLIQCITVFFFGRFFFSPLFVILNLYHFISFHLQC